MGRCGLVDGPFAQAQFHSPQAICFDGDRLLVADKNNHTIRLVDFVSKEVFSIRPGSLANVWAIERVFSDESRSRFIVSASGKHQLWQMEVERGHQMGKCPASSLVLLSGTGAEAKLDHNEGLRAAWAQPSGMSFWKEGESLFVADSESSSIRLISLVAPYPTRTCLGGGKDSDDLFAFGDEDGPLPLAKLQHPMDISVIEPGLCAIADTYNHKVKLMSQTERQEDVHLWTLSSWAGSGSPGFRDGLISDAQFNEPQAVCPGSGEEILVADTNNHSIRSISRLTNTVTTLELRMLQPTCGNEREKKQERNKKTDHPIIKENQRLKTCQRDLLLLPQSSSPVSLILTLPSTYHPNDQAPSMWRVVSGESGLKNAQGKVTLCPQTGHFLIILHPHPITAPVEVIVEVRVYYCQEEDQVCLSKKINIQAHIDLCPSPSRQVLSTSVDLLT